MANSNCPAGWVILLLFGLVQVGATPHTPACLTARPQAVNAGSFWGDWHWYLYCALGALCATAIILVAWATYLYFRHKRKKAKQPADGTASPSSCISDDEHSFRTINSDDDSAGQVSRLLQRYKLLSNPVAHTTQAV